MDLGSLADGYLIYTDAKVTKGNTVSMISSSVRNLC